MDILVLLYSIFTIAIGIIALFLLIFCYISGKNIDYISYTPRSENETEYGLRSLLFMYPNAVIDTPQNTISEKLKNETHRITTHQGT